MSEEEQEETKEEKTTKTPFIWKLLIIAVGAILVIIAVVSIIKGSKTVFYITLSIIILAVLSLVIYFVFFRWRQVLTTTQEILTVSPDKYIPHVMEILKNNEIQPYDIKNYGIGNYGETNTSIAEIHCFDYWNRKANIVLLLNLHDMNKYRMMISPYKIMPMQISQAKHDLADKPEVYYVKKKTTKSPFTGAEEYEEERIPKSFKKKPEEEIM